MSTGASPTPLVDSEHRRGDAIVARPEARPAPLLWRIMTPRACVAAAAIRSLLPDVLLVLVLVCVQ